MVFQNANGPIPGINFAFPDVCLTPTPVGPIPVPYPNMQMTPTAIPAQIKVFLMMMPAHNLMTTHPMSLGDQPGVNLGPASGMVMGPVRSLFGSVKVFTGGPPATKMLSPSGHNGLSPNAVGATLSPSQIKVIVLT
jgi:hypothetical protein